MKMTARTWIRKNILLVVAALAGALLASPGLQAQNIGVQQTTRSLQRALERLPYYGVFDFLAFSVERGTVTLVGYTYTGALKSDAEHAAKRVSGVDDVANKLEVLPASFNDDRIRRAAFYNIYADSFLSRYAAGGARSALYDAIEFGRFPGRQPFGSYPIHIIVKHGRLTLLGAVDNAGDKQLAEFRAREIGGVFAVNNELVVSKN
jgi:hyperosmotically inducible periplasmic protein